MPTCRNTIPFLAAYHLYNRLCNSLGVDSLDKTLQMGLRHGERGYFWISNNTVHKQYSSRPFIFYRSEPKHGANSGLTVFGF